MPHQAAIPMTSQLPEPSSEAPQPSPVFLTDNSNIHEANINVIGRDHIDHRHIKYVNIYPEDETRNDLEIRQRE